jgi:hypothetical protein|tara:strand:+ start:4360 stop:4761 length:402 start_codon:yes stop_codon:yes gene_type:complete
MIHLKHRFTFSLIRQRLAQAIGVFCGAAAALLWTFAMWGPTDVLSLSSTSFFGALILTIFAVVAIIAALHAHGRVLLLMFLVSFCPVGFFMLTEAHWLSLAGVFNLGFLVAGLLLLTSQPSPKQQPNDTETAN